MQFCKILMVDDDPDDVSILEDAIKDLESQAVIFCVENGQAALDLLNQDYAGRHLPSLIVLDLNMPKLNGSETLKAIKKDRRFKDIPIVIYSTSINPVEKDKCLALGAHAYMIKPSSLTESIITAKAFLEFCELPEDTGK